MMKKEYKVEVLCRNISYEGKEIWNPVGYGDTFDTYEQAANSMAYRKQRYPNNVYRVAGRTVSEWKVVDD